MESEAVACCLLVCFVLNRTLKVRGLPACWSPELSCKAVFTMAGSEWRLEVRARETPAAWLTTAPLPSARVLINNSVPHID